MARRKRAPQLIAKGKLVLQLFVAGMSPKSMEAIENIRNICDEHLKDACDLEIIDLYKHPEATVSESIIFSPSLVKQFPLPRKVVVGTMADKNKVLKALGLSFLL
jgi:circadian clock protein KaiB